MEEAAVLRYNLAKEREKAEEIESLLKKIREDSENGVERTLFMETPYSAETNAGRRLSPKPNPPPGPRLRSPPGPRDALQLFHYDDLKEGFSTSSTLSRSPSPRRTVLAGIPSPLSGGRELATPPKISPSPPISPTITASAVRRAAPYTAHPRLSPIAPINESMDGTLPQTQTFIISDDDDDDDDTTPRGTSPYPITISDSRLVSPTKTRTRSPKPTASVGNSPSVRKSNIAADTPPRKIQIRAAREQQQQPDADGKFNIEDALLPLQCLGPFYASLFDEILQSEQLTTKAASRYTNAVSATNAEFSHNLSEILRSMGAQPAKEDFIRQACDEKVLHILNDMTPNTPPRHLKIALQGPHKSGTDEMLCSVTELIARRMCFPRERSTVSVIPIDWLQVLPPFHTNVELSKLYCNYVQHVTDVFCMLNPNIRNKKAIISTYWKKLTTQLHLPVVPDLFISDSVGYWKDLGKRIQVAFHKRKTSELLKMMLLIPKVFTEAIGKRDLIYLYRGIDILSEGNCSFLFEGKAIENHNVVLSAVLNNIDNTNSGVVSLLDSDSTIRLVDWILIPTEGTVKPAHLSHLEDPIPVTIINQTAGCPAYVSRLLNSSSRLATARNTLGSESLNKKRKQLMYLRECAATVMLKITQLSEEIPIQEEAEAFPDAYTNR